MVGRGELQLPRKYAFTIQLLYCKWFDAPKLAPQCPSWLDKSLVVRPDFPRTWSMETVWKQQPFEKIPNLSQQLTA